MNMPSVLVAANIPLRTKKVGNFRIYLDPRISANQLAQFVVSDPSKQETIVRNAKRMSKIRVANYQPARIAVSKCHDGDGLNAERLTLEAARMEGTTFPDQFEDACSKLSAAALRRLAALAQKINCQGVRVSVQPEIVFSMAHRGVTKYGGVIVNFSKGESASLSRESGKYKVGHYAAFLVFQMLALHFGKDGGPRYSNCVAVDVYRDGIYSAPASHVTMQKNVQAACRMISLQWNALRGDDGDTSQSEEDMVF
jgi:hypothetical protein